MTIGRASWMSVEMVFAASLAARVRGYFADTSTILLLGVLVACSLLLILLRRRAMRRQDPRPTPGSEQ